MSSEPQAGSYTRALNGSSMSTMSLTTDLGLGERRGRYAARAITEQWLELSPLAALIPRVRDGSRLLLRCRTQR